MRYRRAVTGWVLLLLMLLGSLPALGEVAVHLNGSPLTFAVPPRNEQGRLLVPMRAIFEALHAEVKWDGQRQEITATAEGGARIWLKIGERAAYVNGRLVLLDVAPKIVENRTLVPLRFVAEALGADVKWDGAAQTVTITAASGQGPIPPPPPASLEELLEALLAATVRFETESMEGSGTGAGFFLNDQGLIVTSYYILEGVTDAALWTHDGKPHAITRILAADREADVAVIETEARGYPSLPVALAPALESGEQVITIGDAIKDWALREGSLTGGQRLIDGRFWIPHSVETNLGNTGSPLVSVRSGQVIGLNSTGNRTESYAVPTSGILAVLSKLAVAGDLEVPAYLYAGRATPSDLIQPPPGRAPADVKGAWEHPRGDLQNRAAAPTGPGTDLALLWTRKALVYGAELLLRDELLYAVHGRTGNQLTAIEAATGERRWSKGFSGRLLPAATGHGVIYLSEHARALWAVKPDGSVLWSRPITAITSPVVTESLIIVADDQGSVHGLSPSTGEQVWRATWKGGALPPAVVLWDGRLLLSTESETRVFDTANGTLEAALPTGGSGWAVVENGLLYLPYFGGLRAVDPTSGAERWRADTGRVFQPPAVAAGQLVATSASGTLYSLETATGAIRWAHPNAVAGAPTIAGDRIYAGIPGGGLGIFALDSGKRLGLVPGIEVVGTVVVTADLLVLPSYHWGLMALVRR